jgi:hypothetical protein
MVDADQSGKVDQTDCTKAVFGLTVERVIDTVVGAQLPGDTVGDRLLGTEVLGAATAYQRSNRLLRQAALRATAAWA